MATETPRPPLPFGTPSRLPTSSAGRTGGPVDEPKALTDIKSLFTDYDRPEGAGARNVFTELTVRGAIGSEMPTRIMDRDVTDQRRYRTPFVLTCQSWIERQRYILAAINPSEVQWTMAQRAAVQKVYMGEIMHVWKDKIRGTYFDEPSITFNFQSGNIMPIRELPYKQSGTARQPVPHTEVEYGTAQAGTALGQRVVQRRVATFTNVPKLVEDSSETQPRVPGGLQNFYEFLQLVDEQKILDDGTINYVYIMYNSRIFPEITLAGLFTPDGTSWTDSSNDPNQIGSWSARFTVYDSFPRLNDYNALIKFFQDAGFARV